ncbi:MAG: tRNA (adenosine(37)-N6)-threonylcarbamoyltransferase complex transferase subunit TsaD [Gemmatimonadetes bacterium]|nr:MAG: tRNA (adenosine(37)-N6)-threonylcarbamoyltransferase complex transferase subunit TsaD [Gemmatimonadota bacterium]
MRVLGIETSCDETSAAVVEGDGAHATLRSLVILSQDVHRVFGGVVPEIASRAHLTAIAPVTRRALDDAAMVAAEIDAIAVTNAPGLVGALLVGLSFAKGLAASLGVPLIGVHHMEGHLFATALEDAGASPPFTALLVSGGHTLLLDVPAWGVYHLLGATRDDAAGEAFDKVAKLLGLPYPGGRHVEALAKSGDPTRLHFARPMLNRGQRPGDDDYYDLSFSGLKTAVLYAVRAAESRGTLDEERAHIARGFQDALVDTLAEKSLRAANQHGRTRIVLGGGVACNCALVEAIRERAAARLGTGAAVFAPGPRLATDNAAMIARAGLFRLARGEASTPDLNAYPSQPIPGLVPAVPQPAPTR